jgi:hypothetical protein
VSANPNIVEFADLRRQCGKKTKPAVRKWASEHGIRVFESDAGPWTTVDALNKALGVSSGASNDHAYGADVL